MRILVFCLGLAVLAGIVWLNAEGWERRQTWPFHSTSMLVGLLSILGMPTLMTSVLLTIPFFIWSPQLLWGEVEIPLRSYFALVALTLLSVWYFAGNMDHALLKYGRTWVIVALVENAIALGLLCLLLVIGRKKPSFALSFAFHWLLAAWPVTVGFPDIIQLP